MKIQKQKREIMKKHLWTLILLPIIALATPFLPNDENANYSLVREVVKCVNGGKVTSLHSFVNSIENSKGQYLTIVLDGGHRFILDKKEALKVDVETMKKYGIGQKERL